MPVQLVHVDYPQISKRAWRWAQLGTALIVTCIGSVTLLAYLPYLGGLRALHELLKNSQTERLTRVRFYGDNWEAICEDASIAAVQQLLTSNDFWMGCCTRPAPTDRICECEIEVTFESNRTARCHAAFWWREGIRGHLQVQMLAPTLAGDRSHFGVYIETMPDRLEPIFRFIGQAAVAPPSAVLERQLFR